MGGVRCEEAGGYGHAARVGGGVVVVDGDVGAGEGADAGGGVG